MMLMDQVDIIFPPWSWRCIRGSELLSADAKILSPSKAHLRLQLISLSIPYWPSSFMQRSSEWRSRHHLHEQMKWLGGTSPHSPPKKSSSMPSSEVGGFMDNLLNSTSACEVGYSMSLPSLSLSLLEDAYQTNCRIRQEITLHFIMG